jgi:hypothetical protein
MSVPAGAVKNVHARSIAVRHPLDILNSVNSGSGHSVLSQQRAASSLAAVCPPSGLTGCWTCVVKTHIVFAPIERPARAIISLTVANSGGPR